MGRTALLMVMGLGMALAVISFNISGTTERALNNNFTYYKYMNGRNLARTAIHAALRGFDKNTNPDTTAIVVYNYGSYQIKSLKLSASPYDTVWMTSKGYYSDTSYTMKVKLYRSTKPFPGVTGAIGIRATPVEFTVNGQPDVDGRNYDATGTTLVGSGDMPGVAVMNSDDSTTVYDSGADLYGTVKVKNDTTTANPAQYISEYLLNADYYLTAGNYSAQTYGSAANPVIVVCETPADTNDAVRFGGGTVGYGILAVKGNIEISGTFDWYGLIVVFGESNSVKFTGGGTPKIVGGLIVAQPEGGAASLFLKGSGANGKVLYSSDALRNARNIGKLRYYSIVDWYE